MQQSLWKKKFATSYNFLIGNHPPLYALMNINRPDDDIIDTKFKLGLFDFILIYPLLIDTLVLLITFPFAFITSLGFCLNEKSDSFPLGIKQLSQFIGFVVYGAFFNIVVLLMIISLLERSFRILLSAFLSLIIASCISNTETFHNFYQTRIVSFLEIKISYYLLYLRNRIIPDFLLNQNVLDTWKSQKKILSEDLQYKIGIPLERLKNELNYNYNFKTLDKIESLIFLLIYYRVKYKLLPDISKEQFRSYDCNYLQEIDQIYNQFKNKFKNKMNDQEIPPFTLPESINLEELDEKLLALKVVENTGDTNYQGVPWELIIKESFKITTSSGKLFETASRIVTEQPSSLIIDRLRKKLKLHIKNIDLRTLQDQESKQSEKAELALLQLTPRQ